MILSYRFPKTLDHYLIGLLFTSILFFVILCSIMFLAPETLFKLIQYVFGGNLTLQQALMMFCYHVPGVLQQSIPAAVLLGSLFVFQRLSLQFELTSLFACGVSPARIITPVVVVAIIFAGIQWAVQELAIPKTGPILEAYYRTLDKDIKDRNFVFVEKDRSDHLKKFFLIGQAQFDTLSNFIILDYLPTATGVRISQITKAKSGVWDKATGQWALQDGVTYQLSEDGVYQNILRFTSHQIQVSDYAAKLLEYSRTNPKNLPWNQMRRYIRLLKDGGQMQDLSAFEVRLNQKYAAPVASIAFAIFGALFGIERIRSNRSFGLLMGILIVAVYSFLTPFSNNLAQFGFLPVWFVAWLPIMLSTALGVLLLKTKDSWAG